MGAASRQPRVARTGSGATVDKPRGGNKVPLVAGRLCVDSPRERCGVLWRCRKTLHVDLGLWFSRCLLLSLPAMSDYVELGDAALSAAEVVPDVVASGAALVGGGVATTSPKRKY